MEEKIKILQKIIPKVLEKNPTLFQEKEKTPDWYQKRQYFLEQNEIFLKEITKELKRYKEHKISSKDLFYMQKLYLCYPKELPEKLLSLPWKNIKLILNLGTEEKREFYVYLCLLKSLSYSKLKDLILNDFYEKTLILNEERKKENDILDSEFLTKALKIYAIVWKKKS